MPSDAARAKAPSKLSLDLFAKLVAADPSIPEPVRKAVREHTVGSTSDLLDAISLAIGELE
jgi:hypothetical protein